MARTGQFGPYTGQLKMSVPTQNRNIRIVPRVFSARPSPLVASEGTVAFQTPCYGIWAHVPHRGFQVLEVNTLPEWHDCAHVDQMVTPRGWSLKYSKHRMQKCSEVWNITTDWEQHYNALSFCGYLLGSNRAFGESYWNLNWPITI